MELIVRFRFFLLLICIRFSVVLYALKSQLRRLLLYDPVPADRCDVE